MQKCKKCKVQFTWKEIYRTRVSLSREQDLKCKECGTVHKLTIRGRLTWTILTMLPALIIGHYLLSFGNFFISAGIALFILFLGTLLAPFLITFEKFL